MKWLTFIPPKNLLQQIEGIEKGLKQNKRIGKIGWIGFIISLAPVLLEVIRWWDKADWATLQNFPWFKLLDPAWVWQQVTVGQIVLIPLLALVVFIGLLIWNRFWLRESDQPFRYTFSLGEFKAVLGGPADADASVALLSHHLCEKINERIGRLLLLDEKELKNEDEENTSPENDFPRSHIHISGHYTKRKDRHGQWILEIMPRVRIGPPGNPETLAYPIRYPLPPSGDEPPLLPLNKDAEKYEQILERLYFTVATEIYKQIQLNVQQKIGLLPSDYFRAVALFYEAEDYARSNTLEAYDEARKLYDRAIYYFDPASRPLPSSRAKKMIRKLSNAIARLRREVRRLAAHTAPGLGNREILLARAELGYARMLLFRRTLAGILGQSIYPVFETRPAAGRAVERLEKLPAEVPGKKRYLFEAYVTTALAWAYMASIQEAREWLNKAEMLDPNRAAESSQYNFVYGEVEAHLRTELQIFRRVVELEPRFEVAQFSLALKAEKLWRSRLTLERNVAEDVLKKYEEVLKLNPGNVGSWANRGYICWLLGSAEDLREARENFLSGREYKEIKRETFVAELDHGLARCAAEQGDFVSAYEYYTSAASAVVTQAITNYVEYYFDLVGEALLRRYRRYLDTVERRWKAWEDFDEPHREFRDLLESLAEKDADRKALIKEQGRFIAATCREITAEEESRLKKWIDEKIKENPAFWEKTAEDANPRLFFERLEEKLNEDLTQWESDALCGIVLDPVFSGWMSEHLQDKANKRVRNSILAFAYNDVGDACYFYYLREGDARYFKKAQAAYERARELNPAFVISLFNLYRLHKWNWDFENAKIPLLEVKRQEPNWPDGKLAFAEVNARLAEKKQNDAEEQKRLAEEKRKEIDRLQDEIGKLRQEAGQLREKILRRRDRHVPKPSVFSADKMDKPSAFDNHLKTRSSGGGEFVSAADESSFDSLDRNFSKAPQGETAEARMLNDLENQVAERNETSRQFAEKMQEHLQKAGELQQESEGLAQEASGILESLLPHRFLWIEENGRKTFNLKLLSGKNDIGWEKEFKDLHVHTLSYLGMVFRSRKRIPEAKSVFYHIQKYFWPTSVFELRDILEQSFRKESPDWETRKGDLYRRLQADEGFRQLLHQTKEIKALPQDEDGRAWNLSPRDLADFLQFNRIIFGVAENWALEIFYPYWALNYVLHDSAFSAPAGAPLPYRGFKLKERKDFFTEAAQERNRSMYFYYWTGDKLKGLGYPDDAREVWKNCRDGMDPHVLLLLAENLKSMQLWAESLELYRQARKFDEKFEEQSKADYHFHCGNLLWAMGQYPQSLAEFDKIFPDDASAAPRIGQIVREVLPHTNAAESYYQLKAWLQSRREYFGKKGYKDWQEDARAAALLLVRDKQRQVLRGQTAPPEPPASVPLMPVVTPVAIEADARLFNTPGQVFSDDHPLLKIHYPQVQERIKEKFGVSVSRLRVRLNESGMAENTYTIIIMEVPIVMGTAGAGQRFLPEYERYRDLLAGQQITPRPSFDPATGELSGAWIGESELAAAGIPPGQTRDCFEYIALHLEAVICEHFGAFWDLQQVENMLEVWQFASGEEEPPERNILGGNGTKKPLNRAEIRRQIIAKSLPDFAARRRFAEVLQWLLKEAAPIINLEALLENFRQHYSGGADIVPLVGAARLALREHLPGNDASHKFLELSPEFEEAIRQNIRTSNGKMYFAIEPQPTQDLLSAARETLANYRQWKTVIVTRAEGIRFHVRRLLEIEFPKVKILSIRELKPELRRRISGRIAY